MNLPPYVNLPGSCTYQQPFLVKGLNQQAFVLKASREHLKKVADKWLNNIPGSPYRFEPLFPFVVCSPIWIDRIVPTAPEWANMGWQHEADFNFGFFVIAWRGLEIDHIATLIPYLVVDNPLGVAIGREVYGYRKVYGPMEYAAGTYQPVAAATWVHSVYSPENELELLEVARIQSPPSWGAATRKAEFEDLKQIIELAAGDIAIDGAMALNHLIGFIKSLNLWNAFLLQLRDAEFPTSAGYSAVVEMAQEITSLNSAWFLPPGFSVKLTDYASYPIISDLGTEVDDNKVATSVLSFQLNFDCILQTGRVLSVAGRTAPS